MRNLSQNMVLYWTFLLPSPVCLAFTCFNQCFLKKFESCKKAEDKLIPVFFSDIRIKRGLTSFPARYTYVDVDTISISSIKQAFADKSKVALSLDDGHQLTDILSNGLKISTGLTVLLGERSSGKTYTLDEISKNVDNPKYIRQFSLLTRDAELDEKKFEETLRNRCASISEEYLMPFKNVVEDVRTIYLDRDEAALEDYVRVLLKLASDADKEDIFSKTSLFSEPLFDSSDLSSLERLISAVNVLIENKEFASIIHQFVNRQSLISLAVALMKKYAEEKELLLKKAYLNDILEAIKAELRVRTAAIPIPDIDFYNSLMNKRKVNRFIQIANAVKREKVIYSLDGEHKVPLDQITKDDLLKMLDLIIDYDAEMDEYDENLVQHAAHKIIYRNLYSKLKDLSSNKTRFKDESTSLYRSAIERYSIELADENAPYKV